MHLTKRAVFILALTAALWLPTVAHAEPTGPRSLAARCPVPSGSGDPGLPGPFTVGATDYTLPDEVISAGIFKESVEMVARVHYPQPLGCGPYPIVFMMHGQHATCYAGDDEYAGWPCAPGRLPLPNHLGFDYLARALASHGIVAVSVSANAVNASMATGQYEARALLLQRHLNWWTQFVTEGGPGVGTMFVGRVDLDRVGTFGHSRGGQAVMRQAELNQQEGSPFGVKAIFLVGATDTVGTVVNGIPLGVLLPYCDGDVAAMPSVSYFDRARYNAVGDTAAKFTFEVLGANHNYYNANWDPSVFAAGAKDDWTATYGTDEPLCTEGAPGSTRLSGDAQRSTAVALAGAFFRAHLQNAAGFLDFLRGDEPPPPSAGTEDIFVGYHPPDQPASRRDVNRFTEAGSTQLSTIGGEVTASGLAGLTWCDPAEPDEANGCLHDLSDDDLVWDGRAPHAFEAETAQLRVAWASPGGVLTHELPAQGRDVSGYRVLQFRALVDFTHPLNAPGKEQGFTVELEDVKGGTAQAVVGKHSGALFYPPSLSYPDDVLTPVPRALFNTARIPLDAFAGIDLTHVRYVRLLFDGSAQGAVNLADLAFAA